MEPHCGRWVALARWLAVKNDWKIFLFEWLKKIPPRSQIGISRAISINSPWQQLQLIVINSDTNYRPGNILRENDNARQAPVYHERLFSSICISSYCLFWKFSNYLVEKLIKLYFYFTHICACKCYKDVGYKRNLLFLLNVFVFFWLANGYCYVYNFCII